MAAGPGSPGAAALPGRAVYGLGPAWLGDRRVAEVRSEAGVVCAVVVEHGEPRCGAVVETLRLAGGGRADDVADRAARTAVTRALAPLVVGGALDPADRDAAVAEAVHRSVEPGWPVRLVPVDGVLTPLPVWLRGAATATVVLLPDAVVAVSACGLDLLSLGVAEQPTAG